MDDLIYLEAFTSHPIFAGDGLKVMRIPTVGSETFALEIIAAYGCACVWWDWTVCHCFACLVRNSSMEFTKKKQNIFNCKKFV